MGLYDRLFECKPSGWIPQTGGATVTKKAVWWKPGKKIHLVGYDDAAHFCQGSIDGSEGDRWRLAKKGEK